MSGLKEEREAQVIAVPTSITHQLREVTVVSDAKLANLSSDTMHMLWMKSVTYN
jgi:hypothetical protein